MQLSVFGRWSFFGAHSKSPNTTKIGVSAGTGENPKWHFWLQKWHFGFSLEKGFYYLWYLKAVLCWKHYFYSVFSKTQLSRHERMQLEQKQKFTKNRGCLPKCKKVFFDFFFAFWWFCFLLPVFLFLCCVKRPRKAISCNFRGLLSILFPQKACLKVFLFFLFCFFCFCLPFQKSIFYLLFIHQPLFTEDSLWGFFSFSFACLFLS